MQEQTFGSNFWKDWIWIFALLAIFGLILLIFGIGGIAYAVTQPAPESVIFVVFFSLPFLITAWALIFVFWFALKQQVVFSQEKITYRRPKYTTFGFKETNIEKSSITHIILGPVALSKTFPEIAKKIVAPGGLTIVFGYMENNKPRTLDFPIFHRQDYFDSIKEVIEELELEQISPGFIFSRKN